jgi:hypothetical protein
VARPKPKLTDEQIRQVETMAGLGLSTERMAAILDIAPRTFDRIIADNPEVSGAIEKGISTAHANVTKTAYSLAVSGKVPAMTMFWLKCRARWKEVHAVEVSGPDGKPVEVSDKSAERKARRALLEEKWNGGK